MTIFLTGEQSLRMNMKREITVKSITTHRIRVTEEAIPGPARTKDKVKIKVIQIMVRVKVVTEDNKMATVGVMEAKEVEVMAMTIHKAKPMVVKAVEVMAITQVRVRLSHKALRAAPVAAKVTLEGMEEAMAETITTQVVTEGVTEITIKVKTMTINIPLIIKVKGINEFKYLNV